jgi:PKD repeat protein
MVSSSHILRVFAACAGALALALAGCVSALPASADTLPPVLTAPVTVSSDGLPTVQIDGVAWQQVIVGNTVYVAGSFSTARPAGAAAGVSTVPRANLLAYDIRTGDLITTWAPALNAQALAIAASPDGSRIYVGGDFTSVNGASVWRIAAIDATTGALIPSFVPQADTKVRAIVASGSTVYFGGLFSSIGGTARARLAAARAADGSLLPWAPSATGGSGVNAMVVSPDGSEVVVGGSFTALNGSSSPGYGLGAVDATSGALLPWAANTVVRDAGTNSAIMSLASDSDSVYGTGYVYGQGLGGNLEGTFRADWAGGTLRWIDDCHGDSYGVYPANDVIYAVGHKHYCANIGGFPQTNPLTYHFATSLTKAATGVVAHNAIGAYFDFGGNPSPTLLDWFPDLDTGTYTGEGQAAWTVTGNAQYVVLGGEFLHANNNYSVSQQGLVRFAVPSIAPNKQGPVVTGGKVDLTATSLQAGTARVRWTANWDRDNTRLTYTLSRNGDTAHPVYQTVQDSTFWLRPGMGFVDQGLTPGTTYRYRLVVTDPWGNTAQSDFAYVTVAAPQPSAYAGTVIADQPASFWRLGELSGATVVDWAAWSYASVAGTVTRGTAGAIIGDTDAATTFPGTSAGYVSTQILQPPQNTFTLEAWIKTTTTSGGKIVGFGNSATIPSNVTDRHLYMDNSGKIWFGVYPGTVRTLTSAKSYNDGTWHHVVASLGSGGMTLYVDGKQVGQRTDTTTARNFWGVWRVGGDALPGWPSQPTSQFFAGTIDDVAIYPTALSPTQVMNHYLASGRGGANLSPTASFTSAATYLTVAVDGSGSTDPDGTIASYAWAFGDGATGTGVTASHTYAAAGTYPVSLTVTDNGGATGTVSHGVTVVANQAPAAAFTSTATYLTVAVDGSGSTDADGTIASYAWAFGDGATGTGVTASHTYAAAGTYPVSLTVTDNGGATGAVGHSVTVTAPPADVLAADAFARSVTGGWGSADTGGPWSLIGTTSNFSVVNGAGLMAVAKAGSGSAAFLAGVSSTNTDVVVTAWSDKVANGVGEFASVLGRRTATGDDYRAKIKVAPDGVVTAYLSRVSAAGDHLRIRVQVTGTSPTTVRMRVWRLGATEPTAWQLTTTDATAALQAPGAVGLVTYLSGSTTNVPVVFGFDDLLAVDPTVG